MKKIKKIIKDYWFGRFIISIFHCIASKIMPLLIDDKTAVCSYYKKITGKDIDLHNPKTFCEKINWYKLYKRNPLMQQCADKIGVREYVQSKGYEDHLNEIYAVYSHIGDINIEDLPDKFVLKAAHGSHMNIIVKDKSEINWFREKIMMWTWLHQDIAWSGREWVYKDLPKRILAEKYLEDEYGELRDYKFFCFHGVPYRFQYDIGRFSGKQYRNYYDIEGTYLPMSDSTPSNPDITLPLTCTELRIMKNIAADLSKPFQQVRIDFYIVKKKIYIGEMTFFDGGGGTIFTPDEWNCRFSENWIIEK